MTTTRKMIFPPAVETSGDMYVVECAGREVATFAAAAFLPSIVEDAAEALFDSLSRKSTVRVYLRSLPGATVAEFWVDTHGEVHRHRSRSGR